MIQLRKYASSCVALATLLTFQATATGGVTVDVDFDSNFHGSGPGDGLLADDGYVKLFGFDDLSGNIESMTMNMTRFTETRSTAFVEDFGIIFVERANPGQMIAMVGSTSNSPDASTPANATVNNFALDGNSGSVAKNTSLTEGWEIAYWTGAGSGATASPGDPYNRTIIWDEAATAVAPQITPSSRTGILNNLDAANVAAYYFNGWAGSSPNSAASWAGTITFTGSNLGGTASGSQSAVPEPTSATLAALGILSLACVRRRRR